MNSRVDAASVRPCAFAASNTLAAMSSVTELLGDLVADLTQHHTLTAPWALWNFGQRFPPHAVSQVGSIPPNIGATFVA
jgi:hypothetical protein